MSALLSGYQTRLSGRWAKTKNNKSSDRISTTHRPAPRTSQQQQPNKVPIVTRDSTVPVDKTKFGLVNARSLRNKSLFVRNYVDNCSVDIVALTETWLTDENTTSVSELCRDNFTLIHQPCGDARRGGGIGVLGPYAWPGTNS